MIILQLLYFFQGGGYVTASICFLALYLFAELLENILMALIETLEKCWFWDKRQCLNLNKFCRYRLNDGPLSRDLDPRRGVAVPVYGNAVFLA